MNPLVSLTFLLTLLVCGGQVLAAESGPEYQPVAADALSVPQTLLSLIHTPQVQAELGLTGPKLASFLPVLRKLDGPWWMARIRPRPEQREITAKLEQQLVAELEDKCGAAAIRRLRQLELQSQGPRMLARPDLKQYLQLSASQSDQLTQLFADTDALVTKVNTPEGQKNAELIAELQKTAGAEPERAKGILSPEQQRRLQIAMGALIDTSKFERIYPLAPELIDSGEWVGSSRTRLSNLRGKIVLVHFYAFQCSNCRANFHIYNRWHRTLRDKGVAVIGIQTPETSAESDAAVVRAAAIKDGFEFPVVIDLKHENWTAWANTMWPTVYVIDQDGYVRFWWQGELNWQGATVDRTIETLVERLLAEASPPIGTPAVSATRTGNP